MRFLQRILALYLTSVAFSPARARDLAEMSGPEIKALQ
jgi:hypothetical protein